MTCTSEPAPVCAPYFPSIQMGGAGSLVPVIGATCAPPSTPIGLISSLNRAFFRSQRGARGFNRHVARVFHCVSGHGWPVLPRRISGPAPTDRCSHVNNAGEQNNAKNENLEQGRDVIASLHRSQREAPIIRASRGASDPLHHGRLLPAAISSGMTDRAVQCRPVALVGKSIIWSRSQTHRFASIKNRKSRV